MPQAGRRMRWLVANAWGRRRAAGCAHGTRTRPLIRPARPSTRPCRLFCRGLKNANVFTKRPTSHGCRSPAARAACSRVSRVLCVWEALQCCCLLPAAWHPAAHGARQAARGCAEPHTAGAFAPACARSPLLPPSARTRTHTRPPAASRRAALALGRSFGHLGWPGGLLTSSRRDSRAVGPAGLGGQARVREHRRELWEPATRVALFPRASANDRDRGTHTQPRHGPGLQPVQP